jgi:hypothetical protein
MTLAAATVLAVGALLGFGTVRRSVVRFGRIDRSKLRSIDSGIVGSGALRPDSGAGPLLR